MLIPKNNCNRPSIANSPKKLCVHYNGQPCEARDLANYFMSNALGKGDGRQVSSHYIIGKNGEILRIIPDNEICYCASDNNRDIIHIECCHPDMSGKFTPETENALRSLVSELMASYGISSNSVVRHYDLTGKHCPLWYVQNPAEWERLHALITGEKPVLSPKTTLYRVIAGAFIERENAQNFVSELKKKGYNPYIQEVIK